MGTETISGDASITDICTADPDEGFDPSLYVVYVSVKQKAVNETSMSISDVVTVEFTSGDGVTTGTCSTSLTSATSSYNAACLIAQCMAGASEGQYLYFQRTGGLPGVQATGSTATSTFLICHSGYATSFYTVSSCWWGISDSVRINTVSEDSSGNIVNQTSGGGPGLNYLYLDMGPQNLSSPFSLDTTSLSPGTHELMIVAIDGGAAEAQGYWRGTFQVNESWVYQNLPAWTDYREEIEFFLVPPEDMASSSYTITVSESGSGVVYLSESPNYTPSLSSTSVLTFNATTTSGSEIVFWAIGSAMTDGVWGVGACYLSIAISGVNSYTISMDVTTWVRMLGDINDDGTVDYTDLSLLNSWLNGMAVSPTTSKECDLTGDGVVSTADRVMLNKILNGLAPPRQP